MKAEININTPPPVERTVTITMSESDFKTIKLLLYCTSRCDANKLSHGGISFEEFGSVLDNVESPMNEIYIGTN